MIELSKIKLIVWDLDDTLWTGTLSEGGYQLPEEHCRLIRELTDAGIVNSICSKNEYEPTKKELARIGLWEYFVFASINWDNKGTRIKHIIDNMALRPVNVLFIDDNTFNLQEAKHCTPDLQIATPDIIPEIIEQLQSIEKKDIIHKRLNQYKVLEEKAIASEAYDSNEAFLYSSNIRVTIHTDCLAVVERLHELLMRSNQLNYTKKRISLDELTLLITSKEYDCGYVTVTDNYGDYGIVGFYAKKGEGLEHFLFSCRTMGQMVEQYVYAQLGFPKLDVVGEVRTQLNATDCPAWINQNKTITTSNDVKKELACKILLKGPCDLSNTQSYIRTKENIVTEFTYVKEDTGQVIDAYNHSVHIRGLYEYTKNQNDELLMDCSFVDPNMLSGSFFTGDYDFIFLSSLIESAIPIYRKKNSSLFVAYNDYYQKASSNFYQKYEYVGFTTPEQYRQFLLDCLIWLPKKTTLCIILGSTLSFPGGNEGLAQRQKKINDVVIEVSKTQSRLCYIDVNQFVTSKYDITDSINHYQTRVYYEIAQAIIRIIEMKNGEKIKSFGRHIILYDKIIKKIRKLIKNILKPDYKMYAFFKKIYLMYSRKKDYVRK